MPSFSRLPRTINPASAYAPGTYKRTRLPFGKSQDVIGKRMNPPSCLWVETKSLSVRQDCSPVRTDPWSAPSPGAHTSARRTKAMPTSLDEEWIETFFRFQGGMNRGHRPSAHLYYANTVRLVNRRESLPVKDCKMGSGTIQLLDVSVKRFKVDLRFLQKVR